ncbi:uncharacterized protein LOC112552669 isoform X1 [Pogonomyrmex barbatus]|uniref:Uncharacterized protein LOC112552669 isoform X1 n=1 Tax=Pogonomyrmex barbatus TaxID=144034 RepID=A0A8N1S7T7_9HYME|nr:uncharacterized protein LOC112552669 isoform X1 [Pogonomyrmex barbatus]
MRDAGGSRWIHYSDRAGCAGVRGSLRFSMDDQEITASRSGRKGSAKSGHKAAAIRTSEEETRLFYDRLRDAFEARFEQAAIYDRAGNQLRFLNRKTSGRIDRRNYSEEKRTLLLSKGGEFVKKDITAAGRFWIITEAVAVMSK